MNHPLQGALLRLKWAREHFLQLQYEVLTWPAEAYSLAFTQDFDPHTSTISVKIGPAVRFPTHWRRLASEGAFNLRSALDYVAWELAIWNINYEGRSDEPFPRTQFPISTKPGEFREDQVRDLHANHVALRTSANR